MEFLSDEWFSAARRALAVLETGLKDDATLVIQHIIEASTPVAYQLVIDSTACSLVRGSPDNADVTMTLSIDTANALRSGEVDALQVVQDGRVRIDGDPRCLIEHAELLRSVDATLSTLAD